MSPTPDWVKKLTPSGPQGSELLAMERAKSDVNIEKLSTFLFTKEGLERQQRILDMLKAEKVFDKTNNYLLGRVDKFEVALARSKKMRQLQVKHGLDMEDYKVMDGLISEPGPYGLHASMFLVSLVCFCASLKELRLIYHRLASAIKEMLSSINSFSSQLRITRLLDVMHRYETAAKWLMFQRLTVL
jgi:hypothetical protein